jgi:uncharacterized membrane protein (UPF0127 family)
MTSISRLFAIWFVLSLSVLFGGCQEQPVTPAVADATQFFPMKLGEQSFEARLAVLPHERSKGLMFIQSLDENQGMLFFSNQPERQSFWMRNTYIPLDIGYFDPQGRLLEVHSMAPHDETPIRSHSNNILFALEMPQGWFRKHNLFPDQRPQLDLKMVRSALNNRGMDQFMLRYIP